MTKISQLTSIGDSLAIDDQFLIRDVSDGTTPNKSVTVSGIARALPLGSATAPAIAFASDKNTGIYSPAADTVSISTNGSERFRITPSGFVGIGTTSPSTTLHVQGTTTAFGNGSASLFWGNTSTLGSLTYNGTTAILQATTSSDGFAFWRGNTEHARLDTSGRLLLGTSSARANFDNSTSDPFFQIEGNTNSKSALAIIHDFNAADTLGARLILAKNNSTTIGSNTLVTSGHTIGSVSFQGNDGTEFVEGARITAVVDGTSEANDLPTRLVFSTTADGSATPSPRMTIKADGSVGVGTQTPATRLDINTSTAQTALTLRATTDTIGVLKLGVGGGVSTNIPSIKANTALEIGTEADQPLVFYTGVSVTERLRIAANGLHTINSSAHSGAALSTTAPAKLYISTGTYTDTSTAASDTVAHGTIVAFDNPAINSTNATVAYTNASTVYIDGAPTGTGNVTVTNGFALYVNAGRCHFGGSVLSASPTDGVGYKTGAGGTVTQATSRTTGVTINKICGSITLVSAAGSTSYQSFTVTNSTVAATDTVIVNQQSGTDLYDVFVTAVAAGSFRITFATTGGTTTEQPVFNFSVLKAVAT